METIGQKVYVLLFVLSFLLSSSLRAAVTFTEGVTPTADWPVAVTVATGDPGDNTTSVIVNGSTIVSQSFTPASTMTLSSIYLSYSTSAASATNAFSLRIQQVSGPAVQTYTSGTNLLGSTPVSFSLANTAGATRLLRMNFTAPHALTLTGGVTYIVEIVSASSSMILFRRGSDVYNGGLVYTNRSALNYPSTRDIAMAVVAGGSSDTQAPSTPSGLTATAVSTGQINLSWSTSSDNVGVAGYKIFRAGTQIDTSVTNSFSDTGLSPSTTYSYSVAAYDAADNTSAQSTAASATTQSTGGGTLTLQEGITPTNVWPESVTLQTGDPGLSSSPVLANATTIVSQSFTPAANMNLGAIYLAYSTPSDSATNAFTIRIQQVSGGSAVQTYTSGTNLLGGSPVTFDLESTGGAIRLLKFELGGSYQLPLTAGTTYAVEIVSNSSNLSFYRRGSDSYAGGNAYSNRTAINYPSTRDLAMALVTAGSSGADSDSDGIPNSWETTYGLNPNSATDAALDPDADGLTNLQEYQAGTNPLVHNGSSTVTASVVTANAYELESTYAAIQINRTGTGAITVNYSRSGLAATSDYTVKDVSGTTLNGTVTIPNGTTSVVLRLHPTSDSLNEYPETATITVLPGSGYTVGATPAATATINDATNVSANEQLFVAALTPASGVTSSASGVGVMYLNGSKTSARVSLNFNGLSSAQTNAYIRYGGSGTELRANLGTGQLTDIIWNIVPAGALTGQQIITALFQGSGTSVYSNVGTANYPAGEIQGTWAREVAGGTYPPPAAPAITAVTGEDLDREVARFLTQATFGPSKAEIDALVSSINTTYGGNRIAAYEAWIDTQLSYDQTKLEDYVRAINRQEWSLQGLDVNAPTSPAYSANGGTRWGWWLNSLKARDQLRQRFAFAASEIFVVSLRDFTISLQAYGTSNYYDMLGSYASGNFRDLLESVSKHPIMAQYLSSLRNQKAVLDAQGNQIISPDENYAREVMQLFSIGLVQRRLDGAVQMNGDQPIPTYNNEDIQNLARVFTGWSFGKTPAPAPGYAPVDNTNFFVSVNSLTQHFFAYVWTNPMKNFAAYHDTNSKVVLGTTIPAGLDGEADFDAAHNILFNHGSTPAFISRQLIQRFVTSNPSPGYIYRVASKFENNGSGVRGDMKAVLKAILLDYEARTLSLTSGNSYGKQREPLLRASHIMRAFDCRSQLPLTNLNSYGYPASQLDNFPPGATHYCIWNTQGSLSQSPQFAPSVFNWFLPDFAPTGPVAEAGLVAPEMQIVTETTAISMINFHRELVAGNFEPGETLYGITDGGLNNAPVNLTPLVALYDNARASGQTVAQATATALDYVDGFLMAGSLKATYNSAPSPNPRSIIINAVASMSMPTTVERMRELLYLLVTSPEYIHQK